MANRDNVVISSLDTSRTNNASLITHGADDLAIIIEIMRAISAVFKNADIRVFHEDMNMLILLMTRLQKKLESHRKFAS
jgi:hypothetical protein